MNKEDNKTLSVLVTAYKRPHLLREVLVAISSAPRVKIYIAIDGAQGQSDGKQVRECIALSLKYVTEPSRRLVRERNLGCRRAMEEAISWFFSVEERGLILEEDILPAPQALPIIAELLQQHATDKTVFHINCYTGTQNNTNELTFRYSSFVSSWGWATWRDRWRQYSPHLALSGKALDAIVLATGSKTNAYSFYCLLQMTRQEKYDSWAYRWNNTIWENGGRTITPSQRLVALTGVGQSATHTKNLTYLGKVHELPRLPIKQKPTTLSQDVEADRKLYQLVGRTNSATTWFKLFTGVCAPRWLWRFIRKTRSFSIR